MSAHTPGPWEVDPVSTYRVRTHTNESGVGRGQTVCFALGGSDRHDEPEANARLIAAAPEMLEALRDVLDDLERRYDGAPDSSTKWMIRPIQAIEAVIAKAEGKR